MRRNNFILTEAEDVAYIYDEIEDFVEKYGVTKIVEVLSGFLKDYEKRQSEDYDSVPIENKIRAKTVPKYNVVNQMGTEDVETVNTLY